METKFATIFTCCNTPMSNSKHKSYKLFAVTFVDCEKRSNHFIVKSNYFEQKTYRDFDMIKAPDKFIFGQPKKIVMSDKNQLKIHIFSNKFINKLKEEQNSTNFEIYNYIAQKLSDVKFTHLFGNIYGNEKPNMFDYIICPPFNKNVVKMMLYEEEYVKNIENSHNMKMMVMGNGTPSGVKKIDANSKNNNNLIGQKDKFKDIDIKKIILKIKSKIVGQDEAIKTLVSNIYYNQVLIDELMYNNSLDVSELDSRKVSILLDGSTGTGKTAIAKEIASNLNLPIEIVNANSFSETGYVGPTITDILSNLLKKANGDINLAERGIVVLDEIDKIASERIYNGRDMKRGVQEELLSFIGGGKYDLSGGNPFSSNHEFDTSKLTFILSGAFTNLRDKKIKENEQTKIGFDNSDNVHDKSYIITPEDYIDYGLMREFFGRIKVLTYTKTYTKEDLKTILLKSEISPLKNFEKTVKMFGYNGIIYNNNFIDKLVEEAYKMKTGARSLQTIMSEIQNEILTDLILNNSDDYIELDESTMKDYQKSKIRKY